MLDRRTLLDSMDEAYRFIYAVEDLLGEMHDQNKDCVISGSARSGKVRRRSMDLTKILIELRRAPE